MEHTANEVMKNIHAFFLKLATGKEELEYTANKVIENLITFFLKLVT
jgi:hypothetical protein